MQLKFYKKNDRWYADVPGHTEEENEMVCGADKFLDILSDKLHKTEIYITMSDKKDESVVILYMQNHDEFGAEYHTVSSIKEFNDLNIWICNVTHDVLGEHPNRIYIYSIK